MSGWGKRTPVIIRRGTVGSIYCQVCALDHVTGGSKRPPNQQPPRIGETLAAIERNIMARLQILEYPDPRLRTRAEPVTVFDAALAKLAEDMFETMYAAPGVGLAATQVNVHKRLIVIDVSEDKQGRVVYINPELLTLEGTGVMEEGCLSVPGIFDEVKRAARVRARYQDLTGKTHEVELEGLAAVCLQHEMDHLDGKLFVDYLSDLKRERIRKKLDKDRKERASKQREPEPARAL